MNTKTQTKRNHIIDLLKVIGIIAIITAHTNAPFTIQELRCFDVTIMLIISITLYIIHNT